VSKFALIFFIKEVESYSREFCEQLENVSTNRRTGVRIQKRIMLSLAAGKA
jgi:hypothetical protein